MTHGSTKIPAAPQHAIKGVGAHPTANKAPELVRQSTSPVDSSKPGRMIPWTPQTGYNDRPTARNKTVGKEPMMDYGLFDHLM
jgi:hypothetical protein